MNKKGFSLIEIVMVMAVFSIIMLMLGTANSMLLNDKRMMDKLYQTADTYDYLVLTLTQQIKGADGTFQVENNGFRIYKKDGTYSEISFMSGGIYVNKELISHAKTCVFNDLGSMIQIDAQFEDMPDLHLVISKPQYGFDG